MKNLYYWTRKVLVVELEMCLPNKAAYEEAPGAGETCQLLYTDAKRKIRIDFGISFRLIPESTNYSFSYLDQQSFVIFL